MAIEYDRRLMLRVILLIVNALGYLHNATKPAPTFADDMPDIMRAYMRASHLDELDFARKRAEENITLARITFALIVRQAGMTLDKLEKN